jgi:hypothetical protein
LATHLGLLKGDVDRICGNEDGDGRKKPSFGSGKPGTLGQPICQLIAAARTT